MWQPIFLEVDTNILEDLTAPIFSVSNWLGWAESRLCRYFNPNDEGTCSSSWKTVWCHNQKLHSLNTHYGKNLNNLYKILIPLLLLLLLLTYLMPVFKDYICRRCQILVNWSNNIKHLLRLLCNIPPSAIYVYVQQWSVLIFHLIHLETATFKSY
jgi:hypothetical protein